MDFSGSRDDSDISIDENSHQGIQLLWTKVNELTEEIKQSKELYDKIIKDNRRLSNDNQRLRNENESLHREIERLRKPLKSDCCCIHLFRCFFGSNRRAAEDAVEEAYHPSMVRTE